MLLLSRLLFASLLGFAALSATAGLKAPDLPPNMMPCDQVLKLTSSEYVQKYNQVHGDNTEEKVKAIYQYGTCYDQAQDALRDQLAREGHAPLMGAADHFHEFERALEKFTTAAFSVCSPEPSLKRVADAYATLYQKQFRPLFYQQQRPKAKSPQENPQVVGAVKAKLDSLINHLPPGQAGPVRTAYDAYYQAAVVSVGLPPRPVYEYAIMLLQPLSDKPWSSAPF
jgi:hypothetical protein